MRITIKKGVKQKITKDSEGVVMIGRVVPNPITNNNDLFDKEDRELRFHIKPLCKEPASFRNLSGTLEEETNYIIFGSNMKKVEEITKNAVLNDKSERELRNYLESNFFIFRPYINFKEASATSYAAGVIQIEVHKNTNALTTTPIGTKNPTANYTRLPRLSMTLPELAVAIDKGNKVDLTDYPASLGTLEYILFEDYIVRFSSENITTIDSQGTRWFLSGDIKKVCVHSLTREDNSNIIGTSTYISFIEDTVLEDMDFSTTLLQEVEKIKNMTKNEDEPPMAKGYAVEAPIEEAPAADEPKQETDGAEITFIKALAESCQRDGLLYSSKDLVNFHTAVKTNFLTMITGATGIGKSQLAVKYADLLCGSNNKLLIPVETSFLESDDVIGYLNISNGIYHASKTGLVDFLIDATKHEDKMYIVIFDEMNLSQVEHWFAPFISILEQKEKILKLYSGFCMNGDRYPEKIKITNNVRFIGTINLDETVKEFSDRLLDRTNLVELHKPSFKDIMEIDTDPHLIEVPVSVAPYTSDLFQGWIKKNNTLTVLSEEEIQMLESLTELIEEIDHRKGISFRVIQSIDHYLSNIPNSSDPQWTISKAEALDLQVCQRIISKFKGTPQSLRGIITPGEEQDNKSCPLLAFFNDKYKHISDFSKTKGLINRKIKELKNYGYTY